MKKTKSIALLYLILFVTFAESIGTTLNLEELESTSFSIDIIDRPLSIVKLQELDHERDITHMRVASKHGQQYLCSYKDSTTAKEEVQPDAASKDLKITDILESMRGSCLLKKKDWWSYEFCYGEEITQFHLHNGKKSGDIISLGKYSHDYNWSDKDTGRIKKTVNRYHTQQYVNGSVCDLTNQQRRTEVRFSCMESEADHIGAITELEACAYVVFLYTSKVCHHPYLKPTKKYKPSIIQCQPIVTQTTYEKYIYNQEIAKLKQKQHEEQELVRKAEEEEQAQQNGVDDEDGLSLDNVKETIKQQLSSIFNVEGIDDVDIDFVDFDSLGEEVQSALTKELESEETAEVLSSEAESEDESETSDEFVKRARAILNTENNQKLVAELTGKSLAQVKADNEALQKKWDEEDRMKREAAQNGARGRLDRESLAAQAPDNEEPLTLNGLDITESLREVLSNKKNLEAIAKKTGKPLEELIVELDRIHSKWVKQSEEMDRLQYSDISDDVALRKQSQNYMENIRELLEFRNKIRAALNDGELEQEFPDEVKGPVGMYKENMRHLLSSQFEDIIAKARQEMQAAGEEVSDITDEFLRKRMNEFVHSKLDEFEANEKTAYEEVKKKVESQKSSEAKVNKPAQGKKTSPIKIEIVQPQKLEMEVVDSEEITPDHEYYDEVRQRTQAMDLEEGERSEEGRKKLIALIKPMQPKGTRKEEKSHNKLSQNYNKKWTNHDAHDEL